MSVSAHILGYGLNETDLFRGAILESGGPTTVRLDSAFALCSLNTNADPFGYPQENYPTLNDTAPDYSEILEKTGCSSKSSSAAELECLRQLPFDKFNSSVAATSWSPVIDGQLIPMAPSQSLNSSTFVKIPLLIGANVRTRPSTLQILRVFTFTTLTVSDPVE